MALLAASPTLNAGDPNELGNTDQRGVVRSGGVNIGAYQASATAFRVMAPRTSVAGVPFDVTVTAVDPFGQVAVGYTGTVTFSSADPYGASLPADYPFTLADGGRHTFTAQAALYTAGTWDVTATDTTSGASENGYPHAGTLDFVDNRVNPNTGAISVRAVVPNPRPAGGVRLLSPGMFVRVRLPLGAPYAALLISDDALWSAQGQKFVYIVDAIGALDGRVRLVLEKKQVIS